MPRPNSSTLSTGASRPIDGTSAQHVREAAHHLQVERHQLVELGPPHLDRHDAPVVQPRRCTCATDAEAIGTGEISANSSSGGLPSSSMNVRCTCAPGERPDVVLQRLERVDQVRREQIGPRRHDLPDLDERGAERAEQPDDSSAANHCLPPRAWARTSRSSTSQPDDEARQREQHAARRSPRRVARTAAVLMYATLQSYHTVVGDGPLRVKIASPWRQRTWRRRRSRLHRSRPSGRSACRTAW